MKGTIMNGTRLLATIAVALSAIQSPAGSTINATNRYAYGANVGWLDWRADATNGAVIGQSYCTGYVWSANCGWIGLGNGPTNGWQYSNASGSDWGVNHDGQGHLSGYAYGANIGWITFEQTNGLPKIDLLTGNLSGYLWGANVGWIGFSNAQAHVRTERLDSGLDTDGDGIPDWWEYKMAGNLTTLSGAAADFDAEGLPDVAEYGADTDPLDASSLLTLVQIQRLNDSNRLTWTVEPTRLYRLEQAAALSNGTVWADSVLGQMTPDPATTMTRDVVDSTATSRFYRVKAVVPLSE